MLRVALLAGLAVLAAAARADAREAECLPLAGFGCYYVPEDAPADAPLLIYLRGHHPRYGSNVPAEQRLASARQAFMVYGLGPTAENKQVAVLVSYRSGLGATNEDIAALALETKRTFAKTILAAHSGGYVGLGRTLDAGVIASRVLMLDDFYGAGGDGLPQKLQRLISAGAACAGFYTPHNRANYETGYRYGIDCAVDALDRDDMHDSAVVQCLGAYLDGRPCLWRTE